MQVHILAKSGTVHVGSDDGRANCRQWTVGRVVASTVPVTCGTCKRNHPTA